jgi:hypothetical protein
MKRTQARSEALVGRGQKSAAGDQTRAMQPVRGFTDAGTRDAIFGIGSDA